MKPILDVHEISKKYQIRHAAGEYLSFRERLLGMMEFGMQREEFWALNKVSFEVFPGESIGIVGRNGAGKSTLLKILSKITPPTAGKIVTRGRIASLLEVGTGFHPELTGRENIFFNGSLLGMKRKEIAAKFDEIVDFSGVEKFLDTPLKHYSSGMQLRLAFAVAAFLEPEILIIDEVLAVGDAEFQKKCLGKMENVTRSGRTILFVSHNMPAVLSLCTRGILLTNGMVEKNGPIREVVETYERKLTAEVFDVWNSPSSKSTELRFESIAVRLTGSQPYHEIIIRMELQSLKEHPPAFIACDISNSHGVTFMQALPEMRPFVHHSLEPQHLEVCVQLPPLVPDKYFITLWVGPHNSLTFDHVNNAVTFEILESPTAGRTFPHTADHGMIAPVCWVTKYSNQRQPVAS
jgi:lipopolysaccharide transport system ATP-binding protein